MVDDTIDVALLDVIGKWTERKHEIVAYYATVYSKILTAYSKKSGKRRFHHYYIDGYAAAGYSISKATGNIVEGSALRTLSVKPPFEKYFFVELNKRRFEHLKAHVPKDAPVFTYNGDANVVLPSEVFPKVQRRNYERAFCLLDPYVETNLRWETIVAASTTGTIDVLIHFPVGSINRQVLRKDGNYTQEQANRLTTIWGDDSWKSAAYSSEGLLFENLQVKVDNEHLVEAFRKRLEDVARFAGASRPIPMKNASNVTIYYLIFASNNESGLSAAKSVVTRFTSSKPRLSSTKT